MSILISALMAATFTAVPPSFGSEPAPANFDVPGAPALQLQNHDPSLNDSIGSEPLLVGVGETSSPAAPRNEKPGTGERLARNCACK